MQNFFYAKVPHAILKRAFHMKANRERRGKRFSPRLSNETAIQKTHEIIEAAGGGNHIQARIVHDLRIYLLNKPNKTLSCLNSHPKERKSKAWRMAYSLVMLYLDSFQMNLTTAMIKSEKQKEIHVDSSLLDGVTPSRYMMNMMKGRRRKPRFKARVEEHHKRMEKLAIPKRVSLNFGFEVVRAGTRKKLEMQDSTG